jgi:arylsulfatase A-like enzyme
MYDPADAPAPIAPAEPGDWVPPEAAEWQRSGRNPRLTARSVGELRANYYGKISLIDEWFGRIFAACEARGLMDELLVVFWSDHGELAGDHGLLYKSRFFETALRVPLMVRWPGRIEPGRTCGALAQTVDAMPTLLEAVGTEGPADCGGRSLWPLLRDPSTRLREAAVSSVAKAGRENTMVCAERHKYAVHEDGTGYMLYDLAEDPTEQRNLIGHPDASELEADLRARLRRLVAGSALDTRLA